MKPYLTTSEQRPEPISLKRDPIVHFVQGGLFAARYSGPDVRARILDDVSEALQCYPEDLDFLFNTLPARRTAQKSAELFNFPKPNPVRNTFFGPRSSQSLKRISR